MYLREFIYPSNEQEFDFFLGIKRTCYTSYYPFQILSNKKWGKVEFEPITIFYGGNGSGKTTALNIIAERLELKRDSLFNRSNFFPDYINRCQHSNIGTIPIDSRIITSDDVFDYMLNIRTMNEGIDKKREDLFVDYLDVKYSKFQFKSLDDYEQLKRVNLSRSKTQSKFVKSELMENIRGHSNGESAFQYFTEKIKENALYLLDEPENSLSPRRQRELVTFIEESVRFFGCQFIISTHSPFLLSLKGAKIYDLDQVPVSVRRWTELENVKEYYDFFQLHKDKF